MPLNPPPVIDNNLGLINVPLTYLALAASAEMTFAVNVGANTLAAAQDTVDDFQANLMATFGLTWDPSISVGPCAIKLGDGSRVPAEAVAAAGVQAGSGSCTFGNAATAALIKKTTGLGGKQNRGRTYVPFYVDVAHVVEPGLIDTATVTGLQTHITAFFNQLVTDGTPMVIANKLLTVPVPPLKPFVSRVQLGAPVTAYTLEQRLATQRRRLRS